MPARGDGHEDRRSPDHILGSAQKVLVSLRRYGFNEAFFELAHTAKQQGVALVSLADALVALAQNQRTDECDAHAVHAARQRWGALLECTARPRDGLDASHPSSETTRNVIDLDG